MLKVEMKLRIAVKTEENLVLKDQVARLSKEIERVRFNRVFFK